MSMSSKSEDDMEGWLFKWTNYLKGYQKRWFVLQNDFLSYYRNQSEISHTCRGTINLQHARVDVVDSLAFTVSNNSVQTYYLRASTETDKDIWVNKLMKAHNRNFSEHSTKLDGVSPANVPGGAETTDVYLMDMNSWIHDLENYERLVSLDGEDLLRILDELNQLEESLERKLLISKKSTSLKVKVNALMLSLKKFLDLATHSHGEWQQSLSRERHKRSRMEQLIEELAQQHSCLENQVRSKNESGRLMAPAQTTMAMPGATADLNVLPNTTATEVTETNSTTAATTTTASDPSAVQSTGSAASRHLMDYSDDEEAFFDACDVGFELAVDDVADSFCVSLPAAPHLYEGPRANIPVPIMADDSESYYGSSSEEDTLPADAKLSESVLQGDKEDNNARKVVRVITRKEKQPKRKRKGVDSATSQTSEVNLDAASVPMPLTVVVSASEIIEPKNRRTFVQPRPNHSVNLWSIMKNCIGKELTKIPVPVNFNEPLSMLQRLTEDYEYSTCLDAAANCSQSVLQLAYVAAFTVSSYSTTLTRTGKPFNPLLGETFECDRRDDLGWRSIAEQVSHHPPTAAIHCDSSLWASWQEFTLTSKFRGKYLSIVPMGMAHLKFKNSHNHYSWRKVTSTVHNIIVGKLWIDNHGEMDIFNHHTGETCHLSYKAYSYFSRDAPRRVMGVIYDKDKTPTYLLRGTWDKQMEGAFITKISNANWETGPWQTLWQKTPDPPFADKMYNFTLLAIQLNEMEEGIAPTDSRNRPDQRLMEEGKWDDANREKERLEEKQRTKRRRLEADPTTTTTASAMAAAAAAGGLHSSDADGPVWFRKEITNNGQIAHSFGGQYWEAKQEQNWSRCPDIY